MSDAASAVASSGTELWNRFGPYSVKVVEVTPAGRFVLSIDDPRDKSPERGWTATALDEAWTVTAPDA